MVAYALEGPKTLGQASFRMHVAAPGTELQALTLGMNRSNPVARLIVHTRWNNAQSGLVLMSQRISDHVHVADHVGASFLR